MEIAERISILETRTSNLEDVCRNYGIAIKDHDIKFSEAEKREINTNNKLDTLISTLDQKIESDNKYREERELKEKEKKEYKFSWAGVIFALIGAIGVIFTIYIGVVDTKKSETITKQDLIELLQDINK